MSEFPYKRAARVGPLLQRRLSELLVKGLKDPRIGFAAITEVRLTDDLRQARVFVSVYGDDNQKADTIAGLQASAGYIKRDLGRTLRLRHTPELNFCSDESLQQAARVETLVDAIHAGAHEAPEQVFIDPLPVDTERSEMRDTEDKLATLRPPKTQAPGNASRTQKNRRTSRGKRGRK